LGSGVGASLHCKGWPQTQTWNMRMSFLSRSSVIPAGREPQSAAPVTRSRRPLARLGTIPKRVATGAAMNIFVVGQ
jgi:hypothetical protein